MPALLVAALLVVIIIGSSLVRAQGLCEYATFTPVCVDVDGDSSMRVAPLGGCVTGEEELYLVNPDILTCILIPLEDRITALEERLDACRACSRK